MSGLHIFDRVNFHIPAAFLVAITAGCPVAFGEIAPHEARYRLDLESIETDEGFPLEASGAMAIRLERDCQKWESVQEMKFDVAMEGARPISLHSLVRSLEGLDGGRMEFSGWQQQGGGSKQAIRGTASMNGGGYGGIARFSRPEEAEWDLPTPTQLPIAAMQDLLDGLSRGDAEPQSISFEVLGVAEVIRSGPGKKVNSDDVDTSGTSLLTAKSWLIERAIYFEEIARNEPFLIETLQINANGVVTRFWRDYHTMVLTGELVALNEISKPDC
jgi:hypothetical protein